jgi:transcriptional regulator with XRE-family HTH domain
MAGSLSFVDVRDEIRGFLSSRRARITPEEAGLPAFGANRRVPGLRREEVAMLAGVSVDYYIRLERGDARGASDEVLGGIARALQLNDDERVHLSDLIRSAGVSVISRHDLVRPGVRQIVDGMSGMPAMVRNRRLDTLYANNLGYGLYSGAYDDPARPVNPARYVFLDQSSREYFDDWESAADDMVALLRAETGRNPADGSLTELVGELSAGSEEFAKRWSTHDVLFHRSGVAHLHHPVVGDLTLSYEDLDIATDPGQTLLVFVAESGSESAGALATLADWVAAHERTRTGEAARYGPPPERDPDSPTI